MDILSIIVLGFAIFAIFFTFLAIFMNRWKKVKPKSKCDAKKALVVKYPMIFLYFLMLGFAIIVVHQEDEKVEAKGIDGIINQIRSILKKRPKISEFHRTWIRGDMEVVLIFGLTFLSEREQCFSITESTVEQETSWVKNCSREPDVDMNALNDQFEKMVALQKTLVDSVVITDNKLIALNDDYREEVKRKSEYNIGMIARRELNNAFDDMIKHYESDLEKTDLKREEWYEKTKEFSPKFNIQLTVKLLVSTTTMSIYFLLPISIFAASHHVFLGSKGFTKAILISLYLNGLLTIFICIIAILLSTGLIGRFNCLSEVKKLGLWRLTSPFPFREKYLSICSRPNTTFYADLISSKLPAPDDIMKSFNFETLKTKMKNLPVSNITIKIPEKYDETVEKLQYISGMLKNYTKLECLDKKHERDIEKVEEALEKIMKYKKCVANTNQLVEQLTTDAKYQMFIEHVKDLLITDERWLSPRGLNQYDFSCDKIIDLFSNIGGAVCEQFNVPLDIYWIYIIVTIIVCMLNSLFIIFLYRSYQSAVDDETYQTIKQSTINQTNMNSKNK